MADDTQDFPGLDTGRPNVARMWDFWLGGKDNFALDRKAVTVINKDCQDAKIPTSAAAARETRAWLQRAVRFLAERGIEQFIDFGVGFPAGGGNVHEFAQRHQPNARTIYIDNDGMVLVHGLALLADRRSTMVIHGDLRDPATIFRDVALRSLIRLDRPVAVLFVAVLDQIPDEATILSTIAQVRRLVAPGSYLVVTHTTRDNYAAMADALVARFAEFEVNTPLVPRSGEEIRRFFDGWELVEPGVVSPATWHPELADQPNSSVLDTGWVYAGIGYLPPDEPNPQLGATAQTNAARNSRRQQPAGRRRSNGQAAGRDRRSGRPEIPAPSSSPSPGEEGLCHVVSGAVEAHRSAVACGARRVQREVGDR